MAQRACSSDLFLLPAFFPGGNQVGRSLCVFPSSFIPLESEAGDRWTDIRQILFLKLTWALTGLFLPSQASLSPLQWNTVIGGVPQGPGWSVGEASTFQQRSCRCSEQGSDLDVPGGVGRKLATVSSLT